MPKINRRGLLSRLLAAPAAFVAAKLASRNELFASTAIPTEKTPIVPERYADKVIELVNDCNKDTAGWLNKKVPLEPGKGYLSTDWHICVDPGRFIWCHEADGTPIYVNGHKTWSGSFTIKDIPELWDKLGNECLKFSVRDYMSMKHSIDGRSYKGEAFATHIMELPDGKIRVDFQGTGKLVVS